MSSELNEFTNLCVVKNFQVFPLLEGEVLVGPGVVVVESDEQFGGMHPVRGRMRGVHATHVIPMNHVIGRIR
jgi:hypothetical protein